MIQMYDVISVFVASSERYLRTELIRFNSKKAVWQILLMRFFFFIESSVSRMNPRFLAAEENGMLCKPTGIDGGRVRD